MAKSPKVKVPRNWPKVRMALNDPRDYCGLPRLDVRRWNAAVDESINRDLDIAALALRDPFNAVLALKERAKMEDNRFSCLANIEDIKKLKNLTRKKMEHLIAHERGHAKWRIKEVEEGNARLRQSVDSANYELRQAREKIVELNRMIRAIRMLTETAKLDVMFGLGKKDDC